MKAFWKNEVIAEAPQEDLIRIEGNWYFPASSIKSYYNVTVHGEENADAAWYYPEPKAGSTERVGRDFGNYVAFWHGVEVAENL
jgi:uncharacterized protein (DUF427 family)